MDDAECLQFPALLLVTNTRCSALIGWSRVESTQTGKSYSLSCRLTTAPAARVKLQIKVLNAPVKL